MNDSWHQHSAHTARPALPADRLIEVWPVGGVRETVAVGSADWTHSFRWRLLELEPVTPTATTTLRRAADLLDERGKQYDQPGGERSMGRAVAAFNAITGRDLTEPEGWLLLQVLKDVRQWQRPEYHADSADDCVAYAALKAESLARED